MFGLFVDRQTDSNEAAVCWEAASQNVEAQPGICSDRKAPSVSHLIKLSKGCFIVSAFSHKKIHIFFLLGGIKMHLGRCEHLLEQIQDL